MYIYKAGVVGAGAMGAGIAQVISYSGLPVIIKDISDDAVNNGIESAKKIYQSRVKKGKMTENDMQQKMTLISGAASYDDFSDVDIVIEAVPESMDIKKNIFAELDKVCPENTIFASNTSALSISEMASVCKRSEKVIGMHFFNPPHVMKLVEVIPGIQTSEETIDTVTSFAESLRKAAIRVNECAGFLVNRLLMPYLNEAFYALQEGAAEPEKIDEEIVKFGMPMGPFTLADMLGLDVCAEAADILYDFYGERMRPARLIRDIVNIGRLGVKTGAGIYSYKESADNNPVDEAIKKIKKDTGISRTDFCVERLTMPMINEAVIAFQEGVSSMNDIDIAMMAGTGFPQDKGGPLHLADQIGLDAVLEKMFEFKKSFGQRFWPAPALRRYVGAGWLGKKTNRGFFEY